MFVSGLDNYFSGIILFMPNETGLDNCNFLPSANTNTNETYQKKIPIINLATETSLYFQEGVRIPAKDLGTDALQQMVEGTQEDKLERGFELTAKNGEIRRSRVYTDIKGTFVTPSIEILRQTLKREQLIGTFHSHYFDTGVETGAGTGTFSLADLQLFARSTKERVKGMVDVGGLHVLMKERPNSRIPMSLPEGNFVHEAIREVRANGGVILNALWKIAEITERSGIAYYFTPNPKPNPEGLVVLKNVKAINYIPPRA